MTVHHAYFRPAPAVPALFPTGADALLTERRDAMALRDHAKRCKRISAIAYANQCDRIWRLNARIAQVVS